LESTPKNTGKNNKSRKKETEKSDENGKRIHISSSEKPHKGIAHFTSPMGLGCHAPVLGNKGNVSLSTKYHLKGSVHLQL